MNLGPIGSIAGGMLESILGINRHHQAGSVSTSSPISDTNQLSPFAQILATLQQIQQSNPAHYAQVTQQIAANLYSAAQRVHLQGNAAAANQLNQLAADFTGASTSGQLPSLLDLGQLTGGHQRGHYQTGSLAREISGTPLGIIRSTLGQA